MCLHDMAAHFARAIFVRAMIHCLTFSDMHYDVCSEYLLLVTSGQYSVLTAPLIRQFPLGVDA